MRFAILIYTDGTLLDALPPGQFDAKMRDCLAHADELRQDGRLLDSQMLQGAAAAKSVRVRTGRRTVVDGPFTETKELLAGFNLIEAEDMDEAVRIAAEFPWVETGCVEVRAVQDIAAVRRRVNASLLLVLLAVGAVATPARAQAPAAAADTIRIEVGSPSLDGRVYAPHAALVRVRIGDSSRVTATWTNELTLGDSAGRRVMRWVTKGTQAPGTAAQTSWELRQTYDAVTLAPYTYSMTSSAGGFTTLTIAGRRVTGTRRVPGDTAVQQVDVTLDRPGFFAGASDLVPLAVGLKPGIVITAPVWSPAMTRAEGRVFTVLGKATVDVEGTAVEAWKVEERRQADRALLATWYLLEKSPYMVYGEMVLPSGQVRRMTEVEIPQR